MEVNWDRLDPRLQCVDGLDDIMRFDLQHFCRRMQPPEEPHYRSAYSHLCTAPFYALCYGLPDMTLQVPQHLYPISAHTSVLDQS